MSQTYLKSGQKSCYPRCLISARESNRRCAVTRRTCFLLPDRGNSRRSYRLADVTAVTFRPTTERALALLRGSKVTRYFPRGSAVTDSTLPISPRWQPKLPVGSPDRNGARWCAQAHAFGRTECELFGQHPLPERPAANYNRLPLGRTGVTC
jgi:hypothetical protein